MPDRSPQVDTLQSAIPSRAAFENVPPDVKKRMKTVLMALVGLPYAAFILWCAFLLSVFPNRTGAFQNLLMPGVFSALAGIFVLIAISLVALKRILRKGVPQQNRIYGLVRLLAFVLPGIAIAAAVPMKITKEPPLGLDIIDPLDFSRLIAPVSVTFGMQSSLDILARRGLNAVEFSWDFDVDGQENEKTVVPEVTAVFDRQGSYPVSVKVLLSNGSMRTVSRRVSIPKEVFSVSPLRPGAEEPVRFSVARLVDDVGSIREVMWDFDSDGIVDQVSNLPDAVYSYLRTGDVKVTARVKLENQTQKDYERVITIYEPQPPTFPVEILSEPQNLIGPSPFGAIFSVESGEEIEDVIWDFGDGEKTKGKRVGHTFKNMGVFQVSARVHAADGEVAQISQIVRVVGRLDIPDLTFESEPPVLRGELEGEVPVNVRIVPRTSMPLIDFKWEAPGATSVGSTENELNAIYRRAGKYEITLVGQDPDAKVLRKTITLTVNPPSSQVVIHMNPAGGVAPQMVRFDASETSIQGEEISGFEWEFGDEKGVAKQLGALVEHLFEKAGTFSVKLRAFTTSGKTYTGEKTIVIRAAMLDACAKPSRTQGKAPLGVSFSMDCTTGNPEIIKWEFGDGTESEERNPIHVFESPGKYPVLLTVTDSTGTQSTETISITAE